jgi:hypothetical protein
VSYRRNRAVAGPSCFGCELLEERRLLAAISPTTLAHPAVQGDAIHQLQTPTSSRAPDAAATAHPLARRKSRRPVVPPPVITPPVFPGKQVAADFFPIGVWSQPTYLFGHWKSVGVNTLVGYESEGNAVSLDRWNRLASQEGLWTVRQPAKNPPQDKDDPNLLAWMFADEPDLHGVSAKSLAIQYNNLKLIDPARAVFVNFSGGHALGWQGHIGAQAYQNLLAASDWVSNDIYPVTGWIRPDKLDAPGQAVSRLATLSGGKPQFAVIETSDQELPWLPRTVPGVTPGQMDAEIWGAINHGARGIIYFPQQIGWGFKYDNTPQDVLDEMAVQNARLTSLGGPLQSPLNPAGLGLALGMGLQGSWRSWNGKSYFIVTNMTGNALDAGQVQLQGVPGGRGWADVYGENRGLSTSDGGFTDHFAPYETHIYVVNQ